MRLVKWTTALIFVLTLGLPAVLSLGIRDTPSFPQPSLGNTRKIYEDSTAFQSFTAEKDLLSGLGASIKNPNFANKKDIILEVFDESKSLIRTATLNGKSIADGNFVKFYFRLIEGSLGKKYTFVFSAPTATKDDALEVFLIDKKSADTVGLTSKSENHGWDISFVSFYRTRSFYSLPLEIYTRWFNKLTSDLPFFVGYLAVLSALLYLVLRPSKSEVN